MPPAIDTRRARPLSGRDLGDGPIIYWMSRDQRASDNWALLHAQRLAAEHGRPLGVAFCLASGFLGATWRQYGFMLRGLREVERDLAELNVPFHLLVGDPAKEMPAFLRRVGAGAVVVDFDPLREKRAWRDAAVRRTRAPVIEVDAHNVVPCWVASDKREWAARTLRPRLRKAMPGFLTDIPAPSEHPTSFHPSPGRTDWTAAEASIDVDRSVGEVDGFAPGERAAARALSRFLDEGLHGYDEGRNDPNADAISKLSPYLHFGQLSAQRVALLVSVFEAGVRAKEAFLDQLIVRRELSDNFCLRCTDYDTTAAFPEWGRRTLDAHRGDPRPYLYSLEELEAAGTHDELWNAAQRQMVRTGHMHGYLRMYWAKKLLEWTETPERAMREAVRLNDRYELDGRDPNGYANIAWSIGGVHDTAWGDRPVFGKVRYMSLRGARSKFDVDEYVRRNP